MQNLTWERDEFLHAVKLSIGSAFLYGFPRIFFAPQNADWAADLRQQLLWQRAARIAYEVKEHIHCTRLHAQHPSIPVRTVTEAPGSQLNQRSSQNKQLPAPSHLGRSYLEAWLQNVVDKLVCDSLRVTVALL
jgi:hypothetical protein